MENNKDVDKLAPKEEMITLKPSVMCQEGHEFFHMTGNEAKCKNCPLGYQLGGAIIKSGHIYSDNQLLI